MLDPRLDATGAQPQDIKRIDGRARIVVVECTKIAGEYTAVLRWHLPKSREDRMRVRKWAAANP